MLTINPIEHPYCTTGYQPRCLRNAEVEGLLASSSESKKRPEGRGCRGTVLRMELEYTTSPAGKSLLPRVEHKKTANRASTSGRCTAV